MKIERTLIINCYCNPNVPLTEYDEFLYEEEQSFRAAIGPGEGAVIVGNFNAKSTVWGSSTNE